jgi:predicted ATP-dependent endonuclease of OLD family
MAVDEAGKDFAKKKFGKLSSGHAIVLLTVTRLVELVDERSLVLIDEPEVHLHPPLLSAFVRALSDLLVERNGVAIVATHSPVALQEIPRSCAWILNRSRLRTRSDRPEIETFGENVSVLTRHVFGLEVTRSGFHALIATAVNRCHGKYEQVLQYFNGQLGAEGRAIAMGLCADWTPAGSDFADVAESE